jgi:hypothetical protein
LNSIFVDEIGLGKAAQIVTLLKILAVKERITGPFLIVSALASLEHEMNEFERWSNLKVFIFHLSWHCECPQYQQGDGMCHGCVTKEGTDFEGCI